MYLLMYVGFLYVSPQSQPLSPSLHSQTFISSPLQLQNVNCHLHVPSVTSIQLEAFKCNTSNFLKFSHVSNFH